MEKKLKEHGKSSMTNWTRLQKLAFTDIVEVSKGTPAKIKRSGKKLFRKVKAGGRGVLEIIVNGSKIIFKNLEIIIKGIIALIVLVILKEYIELFFEEFLINPILSRVHFEEWLPELLFILVIVAIFNWNAVWRFKFYVPSLSKTFIIFFLAFVYSFYRFYEADRWIIYDSTFGGYKTLDYMIGVLILIQVVVLIFYVFRKWWNRKHRSRTGPGFYEDLPIESVEADEYGYKDYARQISNKILGTNNEKAAFAIGINGKWGTGKTSLMNLIRNKFKSKSCIIIDYDPWKSKDSSSIIPDFFHTLEEKIRKYHFGIGRLVQAYSQSISEIESKSIVHYVVRLFIALFYPRGNTKLFNMLNNKIKGIGKKIIVFIDDLDRLDKSEIIQCLKLVRNSANFSNVVFIVAYDREYLVEAIKELNPHNKEVFLEKIFQIEINLPYFKRQILKDNFIQKLSHELPPDKLEELEALFKPSPGVFISQDYFKEWIHHIRDVTRLANSLALNYEGIWNEVDLEDAIKIELVRIKYPAIFKEFTSKRKSFLGGNFIEFSNYYSLSIYKEDNTDNDDTINAETVIEWHLKTNYIDILKEDEIKRICNILEDLFPPKNNGYQDINPKNPLSIRRPSRFLLYCQYHLGNGLMSNLGFVNSLDSFNSFKDFIDRCIEEKKTIQLAQRIVDFYEFDNVEIYEIIVKGIFYLGNKAHNNDYGYKINFNYDFLMELLAINNGQNKLYPDDNKSRHKEFILEQFKADHHPYGVCFNSNFLYNILIDINSQNFINHLWGTDETVQKTLICYLKYWIEKEPSLNKEHIILYYNCVKKSEVIDISVRGVNRKPLDEANEIMIEFILKENVINFLEFSIGTSRRDSRFKKFTPICKDIFGSNEIMISTIKENRNSIKDDGGVLEEVIEFSNLVLNAPEKMARYKFDKLKLKD